MLSLCLRNIKAYRYKILNVFIYKMDILSIHEEKWKWIDIILRQETTLIEVERSELSLANGQIIA